MNSLDLETTSRWKHLPADITAELMLEALELLSWPPAGEDDRSHSAMAWRARHDALLRRVTQDLPGLLGVPMSNQPENLAPTLGKRWVENIPLESAVSAAVWMLTAEHDSPGWELRCAQMLAAALNNKTKHDAEEVAT